MSRTLLTRWNVCLLAAAWMFLWVTVESAPAQTWNEPFRTFFDVTGKYSIQGQLLDIKDQHALLRRDNATTTRVPLDKLREEDRQYVLDHAPSTLATEKAAITAGVNSLLDRCEKAHADHDLKTMSDQCVDESLVFITIAGPFRNRQAKVITRTDFPASLRQLWDETGLLRQTFVYRDVLPLNDRLAAARLTAVRQFRDGRRKVVHTFELAYKRDETWRVCLSLPLLFSPTLMVTRVVPDSASDRAGLKVGDEVIVCGPVGAGTMEVGQELRELLVRNDANGEIALTVVRGNQSIALKLPGNLAGASMELRLMPNSVISRLIADTKPHPVKIAMRNAMCIYANNDAAGFAKMLSPEGFIVFDGPRSHLKHPQGLEDVKRDFAERVKTVNESFDLSKTSYDRMRVIAGLHIAMATAEQNLCRKSDGEILKSQTLTHVFVRQGSDWLQVAEVPWRLRFGLLEADEDPADQTEPARLPWPGTRTSGPQAKGPRIETYACQTAIAGRPFVGPAPRFRPGTGPCRWSLRDGPKGMVLDCVTGRPVWPRPTEGRQYVTIRASNEQGVDEVQWLLRIVRDDIPDAEIVASRYFDFVVPAKHAQVMRAYNTGRFADAYWRYVRDLVGQEPGLGRQVVKYDPTRRGAVSGNPVLSGSAFFPYKPEGIWRLGAMTHEVGHNFMFQTRIRKIIHNNRNDLFYHHGCEFIQQTVEFHALNDPARFGLSGVGLLTYQASVPHCQGYRFNGSQDYAKWVKEGGRAETCKKGWYSVWAKMVHLVQVKYGNEAIENTLRAMRVDVMDLDVYNQVDTPLKQDTLLQCMFSAGAGEDLRPFFKQWGFATDDLFYSKMLPIVTRTLASRPREDENGWKRCPLNGRYYRLTSWPMDWWNAERHAQRLGGHLATIRTTAEAEWIRSRFAHRNRLWIGLSDREQEGKPRWTSGEAFGETAQQMIIDQQSAWTNHNAFTFHRDHSANDVRFIGVAREQERIVGLVEVIKPPIEQVERIEPVATKPLKVDLPNPSFEQPLARASGGWQKSRAGSCLFTHSSIAHTGKGSLQLTCTTGGDAAAWLTVPVKKHHLYRLAGYVRTEQIEGSGAGVLLNVHASGMRANALRGTNDWTLLSTIFDSGERDEIQVNCRIGGWGRVTGDAWFDDVTLEEIGEWPPRP